LFEKTDSQKYMCERELIKLNRFSFEDCISIVGVIQRPLTFIFDVQALLWGATRIKARKQGTGNYG